MEWPQFNRLRGDDLLLINKDCIANVLPDNPGGIMADIEEMRLFIHWSVPCETWPSVGDCQEKPVIFMTLQCQCDKRPR